MNIAPWFLALIFFSTASVAASQERCVDDCSLGVFPHSDIHQMESTYSPMVEDLSLLIDAPVTFSTSSSRKIFNEKIANETFDIALIGSGGSFNTTQALGYRAIARREDKISFSIIVVGNSDIKQISDLAGKRLGVVPPETMTHLIVSYLLRSNQLDIERDFNTKTFTSQPSCVHALMIGLIDACAVASPIIELLELQYQRSFKRLIESKAYPNATYVIHPDVASDAAQEISDYLISRPGMIKAVENEFAVFDEIYRTVYPEN